MPTRPAALAVPVGATRPAVIATASALCVTASMLFVGTLGFVWATAFAMRVSFRPGAELELVLANVADRVLFRLGQGLAVPLIGFPVAAAVVGLLLPTRRAWIRLAFTGLGAAALIWSAWWLRLNLFWWFPALVYIGFTCAITWSPSVTRWYAAVTPSGGPGAASPGATGPGVAEPRSGR